MRMFPMHLSYPSLAFTSVDRFELQRQRRTPQLQRDVQGNDNGGGGRVLGKDVQGNLGGEIVELMNPNINTITQYICSIFIDIYSTYFKFVTFRKFFHIQTFIFIAGSM